MINTAHAHKSDVIFYIFPRPSEQKKSKKRRPKMSKIASRGPALIHNNIIGIYDTNDISSNFTRPNHDDAPKALHECVFLKSGNELAGD